MKTSRALKPFYGLLVMTILLTSCVSQKDMVYFQETGKSQEIVGYNPVKNLTIKPGDLLTIRVSAAEQEAAQPFNLVKSVASAERLGGNAELETYMVSQEGTIEFPVVGTIKVSGYTNFELADKIKNEIREYVRDPIVNVRILNFQISVLGEVRSPGTFSVTDDHINLSKALGMAGDLTIFGKRDNVLIMREENGKKISTYLDLTDPGVVSSPLF
jgi:polysaccharide biosynthesis/export protein